MCLLGRKWYLGEFNQLLGFHKIEGLEENVKLRSLYLQENMIEAIDGLDTLQDLRQLNLSDNLITKVSGLENLANLETI